MDNAKSNVKVGAKAPDFSLLSDSGEEISLASFKGQTVVLYFYPVAYKLNSPLTSALLY